MSSSARNPGWLRRGASVADRSVEPGGRPVSLWVRGVVSARGRAVGGGARKALGQEKGDPRRSIEEDRKSTRLNSSHSQISYAVFCLKKKKKKKTSVGQ